MPQIIRQRGTGPRATSGRNTGRHHLGDIISECPGDFIGIRSWSSSDIKPPMLMRAAELFSEGMTVREVATLLRISKSEAGSLRIRAWEDGLLSSAGNADFDNYQHTVQ
jgi:hypothetical protein